MSVLWGGEAKNFGGAFIGYAKCDSCGLAICRMDDDGIRALKYEARLAWNTRAPILSAEEMEMLEGIKMEVEMVMKRMEVLNDAD